MHEEIDLLLIKSPATPFKKIGQGFCGTVWADPESEDQDATLVSPLALKREDGGPGRSIVHEYDIHKKILGCLEQVQHIGQEGSGGDFRVHFPVCKGLLRREDASFWTPILARLPSGFEPCNALVNERIPSLPRRVRAFLAETYHPDPLSANTAIDDHCLVRPYLGRRRFRSTSDGRRRTFFSLRNFPLYLDQVASLGLPLHHYARAMADALAFLYWTVCVDANDVEFVLAPDQRRLAEKPGFGTVAFDHPQLGQHALWVLDFDCCRVMDRTSEGVQQAVRSFLRNDPFYPRPPSNDSDDEDAALWGTFRSRFLERSETILKDEDASTRGLPGLLIEEIVLACKQKKEGSSV